MASINERQRLDEYEEEHLIQEYEKTILNNPNNLKFAVEYLFDSLIEDVVMTLCFKSHFESKHPVSITSISIESK